eukprot:scaffold199811_cov36-Tisochrysis_lutea.AAC.2
MSPAKGQPGPDPGIGAGEITPSMCEEARSCSALHGKSELQPDRKWRVSSFRAVLPLCHEKSTGRARWRPPVPFTIHAELPVPRPRLCGDELGLTKGT